MRPVAAAILTAAVITITACSGPGGSPSPSPTPDAVGMMMVAFDGYPRRTEIEAVLDPAMDAVGLAKTEANRQDAGSALVSLRKRNGTPEMDILRCMPSRVGDPRIAQQGYTNDFPSVAAVCSVDIMQGRYSRR